jgi:guanylate kinase
MQDKGKLIVISGPSGAGKSTVVFKAIEGREDVCFSTSVTTRSPRPGEVDGREYFFIDEERFRSMVEKDELLEHASYVAHSYGTPRAFVEQKLNAGMNVVLDIEVQGARQVYEKMPEAVMIFVVPPSLDELRRRLEGRGTESEETIRSRLERARQEYREADFYRYIIVNDDIDTAAKEFAAIMLAEHCRAEYRRQYLADEA